MIMFLDFETNGDHYHHRIVQCSYIMIGDNGQIEEVYDEVVSQDNIEPFNTKLTKITQADLDDGIDEVTLAKHLFNVIAPETVIVSHNCQFELSKLFDLFNRHYGYNTAMNVLSQCNYLDTLTVMKDRKDYHYNVSTHSLQDCIRFYNLEDVQYHNSLYDVLALYKLFIAIVQQKDDLSSYLNLFGYNPKYPIYDKDKFEFVTYKAQYYLKDLDDSLKSLPLYKR